MWQTSYFFLQRYVEIKGNISKHCMRHGHLLLREGGGYGRTDGDKNQCSLL